jgi:hypothetical protein
MCARALIGWLLLLLSTTGSAATINVLADGTYPPGVYEIPATVVPTGYTVGYVRLSRAAWTDPTTRVDWVSQLSQDSGASWEVLVSGGARGGVVIDASTELPRAYSTIGAILPQPANAGRRIKATVTISGGPVTSSVSVELQ